MVGQHVLVDGLSINPAFPRFLIIVLTDPQQNQDLALENIVRGENRKMAQVFSGNSHSFNTNVFNYTAPDDRSEILAWLSRLEPRARHRDIGARRIDSIGAWLLETEEFRRWHHGSKEDRSYHPTLFCEGNPGAGKSYIM